MGSPDHVSALPSPGTRPGIRPVMRDDQLEGLVLLSRFPVAFRLPALAFWSSCSRWGVGLSLRSAYRPTAGPRRGFRVSHARAAIGVGALSTPGTTVLILTGVAHRPASAASQRHVPTPRHSIPSIRGSASRSINQGFKTISPVRSSPRLWHPDGAGALGLEPRASHPALTGDARRGGDRPSSTSLKHDLRHRPSLQSCVFTQCERPRVARDNAEASKALAETAQIVPNRRCA